MPKKVSKAPTKAEVLSELSEKTGLAKAQVAAVFTALDEVIAASLRTCEGFTIPGLVKIAIARKPATSARPGRNPFTGEAITIKAKPARDVVRVRALKHLKDMA